MLRTDIVETKTLSSFLCRYTTDTNTYVYKCHPRHNAETDKPLIARRFKILRKEGDTKDNLCVRIAL
jgi:hypothetical protein